jgi:RNA polymerase sigma factor (TIGR02999 family)
LGVIKETPNASELLPLVYQELRYLAASRMARERPGQTLQPTALVHEAWLRVSSGNGDHWQSRGHFFAAAAEAMRRVLVDRARCKQAEKRGACPEPVELDGLELAAPVPDEELLAIDEALEQLATVNPTAAKLVSLRFFAGLTQLEAAEDLEISRSTADRLWRFARAWLFTRVHPNSAPTASGRMKT